MSTTSSKHEWEQEVTDAVATGLRISNGDAQGIVEARGFELAQEWAKASTAQAAAQRLINL